MKLPVRLLTALPALALLWLLLVPVVAVAAPLSGQVGGQGIVRIGEDWTLAKGEHYEGDVMVVSGDATVEAGATLTGDLTVISGNVDVVGTVVGDVNVVSGDVFVQEGGAVQGDVNVLSGQVRQEPGATITGSVNTNQFRMPNLPLPAFKIDGGLTLTPPQPWTPRWMAITLLRLVLDVVRALAISLAAAGAAALLVAVWPEQIRHVGRTVQRAPFPAFATGAVTALAVSLVALVLAITICLLPFSFFLVLMLFAAGLMGWVAVGMIVGQRLWQGLGYDPTPPVWPAAVGVFVITLLAHVPCLGTIFLLLVGSVGLGATLLSQFGTRAPAYTAPS